MVSVLTVTTTQTKLALEKNSSEFCTAGSSMSTGNAFVKPYQDPTGYAIYQTMSQIQAIMETVVTGVNQSTSMISTASSDAIAILDELKKLQEILAKAVSGQITDANIVQNLKPNWDQIVEDINRIANASKFVSQQLLNGTSGQVTAAVASKASKPTYSVGSNPNLTFTGTGPNVTAMVMTFGTGATGNVNVTGGTGMTVNLTSKPTVTTTGATATIKYNATVVVQGATLTDTSSVSGTADIEMLNATITTTGATFNAATGTFTGGTTTVAPSTTLTDYNLSNFSPTLSTWSSPTVTTPPTVTVPTTLVPTLNSVSSVVNYSGGSPAKSTFNFVTGTALTTDNMSASLPNLSIGSVVPTLNVQGVNANTTLTNLGGLTNKQEAQNSIPIVQAYIDFLISSISEIGSFQERLDIVANQLNLAIDQVSQAKGIIGDTNLAYAVETFTRCKVLTEISVSVLKQLNEYLSNLSRLIQ
jgi:flagellin-like hook-associated protein FlgL